MDEWTQSCDVTVHLATGYCQAQATPREENHLHQGPLPAHCADGASGSSGSSWVAWDKDGCKIQHLVHGRLEVKMDQGCPTLEHDVGHEDHVGSGNK